jgi:hypothetical protein
MELSPTETAAREDPLTIHLDGKEFSLWTETAGVSSSGLAHVSNAHWIIRVDGVDRGGWEAHVSETEADVRREFEVWWRSRQVGG